MSRSARRWTIAVGAIALIVAAIVAWAVVPRSLGPVTVLDARVTPASGGVKAAHVVVVFAVPRDLAAVRADHDLGYVAARLSGCGDPSAGDNEAVVTQRAGYLPDDGRVRPLPRDAAGRARYRATFDDVLTATIDHEARRSPAIGTPGGLCFALRGASMWFGTARSPTVRLALAGSSGPGQPSASAFSR